MTVTDDFGASSGWKNAYTPSQMTAKTTTVRTWDTLGFHMTGPSQTHRVPSVRFITP